MWSNGHLDIALFLPYLKQHEATRARREKATHSNERTAADGPSPGLSDAHLADPSPEATAQGDGDDGDDLLVFHYFFGAVTVALFVPTRGLL